MKKTIYKLIILSSIFLFSCNDSEDNNIWEIEDTKITFTAEGGNGYIDISSTSPIEATSNKEWISVSIEKEKVVINVSHNFHSSDRAGHIKVSSGATYSIVSIYQRGGEVIIGDGNPLAVPMKGGEYKLPIVSSYDISGMNMSAFLKEGDKNDLTCQIEDNKSLIIRVPVNKLNIPKEMTIYIGVQTEGSTTIIDSLQVINTFFYDELVGEWTATFNNGSENFSQKIELNNENKLTGFAVKEGSTAMVELPIKYNSKSEILSIVMGEYLLDYEDKYIFINPRTTGSSWSYWRPGGGPEAYNGYLTINNKAEIVISFPNFKYGSSEIGGFTFRTYPSLETSSGSTKSTRSVLSLKLTRKL